MSTSYRTVDARPNAQTLVKPGELVDLVEVTPLTLADRRIYNQLLENAWDAIEKPVTHVIAKSDLPVAQFRRAPSQFGVRKTKAVPDQAGSGFLAAFPRLGDLAADTDVRDLRPGANDISNVFAAIDDVILERRQECDNITASTNSNRI